MKLKILEQLKIYIEFLEYALSVENPLSNLKILQHTDKCSSYIVGGISLNHNLPNSRKEWLCSEDCPLNGSDKYFVVSSNVEPADFQEETEGKK